MADKQSLRAKVSVSSKATGWPLSADVLGARAMGLASRPTDSARATWAVGGVADHSALPSPECLTTHQRAWPPSEYDNEVYAVRIVNHSTGMRMHLYDGQFFTLVGAVSELVHVHPDAPEHHSIETHGPKANGQPAPRISAPEL
jgi:hypothetical protein